MNETLRYYFFETHPLMFKDFATYKLYSDACTRDVRYWSLFPTKRLFRTVEQFEIAKTWFNDKHSESFDFLQLDQETVRSLSQKAYKAESTNDRKRRSHWNIEGGYTEAKRKAQAKFRQKKKAKACDKL